MSETIRPIKRPGLFRLTFGMIKFVLFWVVVVLQLPIIFLLPRGRVSVRYMRVFMGWLVLMAGIRVRVNGQLSARRPLLVLSNHISIFELATFPIAFGGSFIAKKEMEKWPLVGWVSKKFGVVFVDRRPSHAVDALNVVRREISRVSYPLFLFPEGTTTNGAYVKDFKSTLFNVVEGGADIAVQPVVMHYRRANGAPISDEDMARHYAYFDNAKQDRGPKCEKERSAFGQVFHIMTIGGFLVEITVLPVQILGTMDRKQIATQLHNVMSDKYMELKDKPRDKRK